MKIALAQVECKLGRMQDNVEAMCCEVAAAAGEGADLVVFPELCDTGYHMPTIARCATPTACAAVRDQLASAARQHGVNLVAGLAHAGDDGKVFNTAVAFDRTGRILGQYRKIHLFGGQNDRESDVFTAGGDRVILPIDGMNVGLMICYDLRFPELARSLTLDGAELLVVVAAWPAARIEHWAHLARARALENLAALVAVNRVGCDAGVPLGGHSTAFGPVGETLCDCKILSKLNLRCEVTIETVRAARATYPWLGDRQAGAYRL